MTDELVEAVARALAQSHRVAWKFSPQSKMQAAYFRDASAAIAAYEAALWQPIETAPRDGTLFDVWPAKGNRLPDCKRSQDGNIYFIDDDGGYIHVPHATHWRPLPNPPGGAK